MPNALNEESAEVLSETSEPAVDTSESSGEQLSGGSSVLDGNPEDSPYYVGDSEGSDSAALFSETAGTEVYSQDFEQIHTYLEAQHSQQVLTVVLLAAILGTLMVKFFFDRLKG